MRKGRPYGTGLVTLQVNSEHLDAFMESMVEHARLSLEEPGCLRYDVVQDSEHSNRIYVYEVFVDEAAFDTHRQAPHNQEWRETTKDWHPPDWTQHRLCVTVFPPDSAWRK